MGSGLISVRVLPGRTALKNVTSTQQQVGDVSPHRCNTIVGRGLVVNRQQPHLNGNQATTAADRSMMPPLLRTVTVSALVVSACVVGCFRIPSRFLGWLYGLSR